MGRDDPAGGSDLPAPYRNPWAALADALRAVAADLRLRALELRRRNSDGSLWRPSWWPGDLAPLFWPLLLALALAVVVVSGLGLKQALAPQREPAPTAAESSSSLATSSSPETSSSPANAPVASPRPTAEPSAGARAQVAAGEPQALGSSGAAAPRSAFRRLRRGLSRSERASLPEVRSDPHTAAARAAQPSTPTPEDPAAPTSTAALATPPCRFQATASDRASSTAAPDPLAALLSAPEADGWIEAAQARADQGLLVLQLAPGYRRLLPAERQRLARLWQGMAAELGYEHLELRDSRGGLLGRDALVGEGMILFSPSPPA